MTNQQIVYLLRSRFESCGQISNPYFLWNFKSSKANLTSHPKYSTTRPRPSL